MPAVSRRAAPVRKQRAPAKPKIGAARRGAPVRSKVAVPHERGMTRAGKAFRTGGQGLGSAIGSAFGGPIGGMAGGALGRGAGAILSKIFGHGDYSVSNVEQIRKNNLVLSNSAQMPQFGSGKVACKLVHREFLGDLISSATAGAFKIQTYAINPGIAETFPWLSGVVGAKFQQYRINGMTFEFRSMSADALNSTNTALGSVIMSTDYDSADVDFASKQEMENTEYGVSCKPSANMLHGIECERFQTPVSELYIRAFDVPSGKDIRLYDLGKFQIASVGCQGTNVNLGELWVSYDIDVFKAIEQPPGYLSPVASYTLSGVGSASALGLSTTTPVEVVDQIGLTFVRSSGTDTVQFPLSILPGVKYMMHYGILGASTASVAYQAITLAGGLVALGSDNANPSFSQGTLTTASKQHSMAFYYNGTGTQASPPTLAFTGGVVPTSLTLMTLSIAEIGNAYPADGW
ncbi:capsid protein [Crucivirus-306]|nr:capsid protein [Crucivirus-306]